MSYYSHIVGEINYSNVEDAKRALRREYVADEFELKVGEKMNMGSGGTIRIANNGVMFIDGFFRNLGRLLHVESLLEEARSYRLLEATQDGFREAYAICSFTGLFQGFDPKVIKHRGTDRIVIDIDQWADSHDISHEAAISAFVDLIRNEDQEPIPQTDHFIMEIEGREIVVRENTDEDNSVYKINIGGIKYRIENKIEEKEYWYVYLENHPTFDNGLIREFPSIDSTWKWVRDDVAKRIKENNI